jgi:hypothetical protein
VKVEAEEEEDVEAVVAAGAAAPAAAAGPGGDFPGMMTCFVVEGMITCTQCECAMEE